MRVLVEPIALLCITTAHIAATKCNNSFH